MLPWAVWYCIFTMVHVSSVTAGNTSCPLCYYYNATQQCERQKVLEITDGNCITYSGHKDLYYIGDCPFGHSGNRTDRMHFELPCDPDKLNDMMCGPYNRKGLLCGRCIDGYGPPVYSYDLKCADCSKLSTGYAVTLYLLLDLIPVVLFFICMVIFHLKITSGRLLGYVLFHQLFMYPQMWYYFYMQSHVSGSLKVLLHASVVLSKVWSINPLKSVIPPFCISERLTGIHVQMLSLVTVTYPVVLVIITCILMELHARNYRIIHILWRPFSFILNKINITTVTSDAVIHAFASFIVLSNINIYNTWVYVVENISVYINGGTVYKKVLYIDPTVEWLTHKHIEYFLIATVPYIFLSLIPSFLLLIYPTRIYRYLSRCLSARKRLAITAFAEALNSCFKDGLNGTRDYRAFAGIIIMSPILYSAIKTVILEIGYPHRSASVLSIGLCSLILSFLKPCKSSIANLSLSFHSAMFGVIVIAYYLWIDDLSTPTKTLELTFILIPVASHALVLTWAGYTLTRRILTHFGCQCRPPHYRVVLTDFAAGAKQYFHRRHGGYQTL